MLPLREKTLALPPSLTVIEGIQNLREHIVPELDSRLRYVVEVRDRSWFQDLAYNFLLTVTSVWYGASFQTL
jgi:hypothetical protein